MMTTESFNSTSNYSSCIDFLANRPIQAGAFTFVTAISPVVICLDLFVLCLAFKYINFKQNLEQLFVVNMTAADLMFGAVYMTSIKQHANLPHWFCKSFYVLAWTFNIASVNFLLLLNVYKLIILFFPIYSFAYMSKFKVTVQAVLCWLIVFIAAVSFSFEPTLTLVPHACHSCVVQFNHKLYAIMIMCFYIIPLTVSLVLSMLIFGLAQSRSIRRKHHHYDVQEERKKMFGRIFFVFTSTIWASLTFLPYRISYFRLSLCRYAYGRLPLDLAMNITAYRKEEFEETRYIVFDDNICYPPLVENIQCLLLVLLAFGFAINPLITICTQQIYRERVIYLCQRIRDVHGKNAEDAEPHTYQSYSARHSRSCSYQPVSTNSVL